MLRWKPIRPMSCDSGIQLSATSRSLNAAASAIEAMLAHRLRWVQQHALGVSGGTRRVLDEGQIIGLRLSRLSDGSCQIEAAPG